MEFTAIRPAGHIRRGFTSEVHVLPGIEQTKHDISYHLSYVYFIEGITTLAQAFKSELKMMKSTDYSNESAVWVYIALIVGLIRI